MTSVFDGVAGVLASVFGAPVTIHREGRAAETFQAVFRETPVEQETADGRTFVTVSPTLRLRQSDVALLRPGDQVLPASTPNRRFQVLQSMTSGSPATDAFVTYVLEELR